MGGAVGGGSTGSSQGPGAVVGAAGPAAGPGPMGQLEPPVIVQAEPLSLNQLQQLVRATPPAPLAFTQQCGHMAADGPLALHQGHMGDGGWASAPLSLYHGVAHCKLKITTSRQYWGGFFGVLATASPPHRSYDDPSFHGWGTLGHGQHYAYCGTAEPLYCGGFMESANVFNRHIETGDTLLLILDTFNGYVYGFNTRSRQMKWIKISQPNPPSAPGYPWFAHVWSDTQGDRIEISHLTAEDVAILC